MPESTTTPSHLSSSIPLSDQPGHLIRRAHQISVASFHEHLGREVTPVQYALMRVLQDKPGIDQSTLAQEVALDTSTTADIAARLETKGWIIRALLARGQRSLSLTEAGAQLLESLLEGMQQMQGTLFDGLEPAERTEFMRLLRKFSEPDSLKRQGR
ncbi:MarR family winged helix-turn-helix transcriptional regulator [Rhodoferax sp.]|uniref:MarR family winged helix-turn-helix transcriptional regulator n=1 Tax=Rhodoferax sp. TaxID=50421 RepID=UPI00374D6B9E